MIPTDTTTPEQRAKYEAHVKKRTPHAGTTATYVRANLPEVAAALAALTGEPHPLNTVRA